MLKEKIWANFQRIIELFTKKIAKKLLKIWLWDPRSGIRKKPIPDPGSQILDPGVKKAPDPGSGSATLETRSFCHCVNDYSGVADPVFTLMRGSGFILSRLDPAPKAFSADQNPASQNNAEHENPDLQPCLLLSFFHPKYSTYM